MANLLNTKGEFSDDWKDIETSKSIKFLVEDQETKQLTAYYTYNNSMKNEWGEYTCPFTLEQYGMECVGIQGNLLYCSIMGISVLIFAFVFYFTSSSKSITRRCKQLLWGIVAIALQFFVLGLGAYIFKRPIRSIQIYFLGIVLSIYLISYIYSLKNKAFWIPIVSIIPIFIISIWINPVYENFMIPYFIISAIGSSTGYFMQRRKKINKSIWIFYIVLLVLSILRK